MTERSRESSLVPKERSCRVLLEAGVSHQEKPLESPTWWLRCAVAPSTRERPCCSRGRCVFEGGMLPWSCDLPENRVRCVIAKGTFYGAVPLQPTHEMAPSCQAASRDCLTQRRDSTPVPVCGFAVLKGSHAVSVTDGLKLRERLFAPVVDAWAAINGLGTCELLQSR